MAELAEAVTNRTQPMFDALHSSGLGIRGRQNSLVKSITMFFSQRNQNINMVGRAIYRMRRGQDRGTQLKSLGIVLFAAPLGITLIKAFREGFRHAFDVSWMQMDVRITLWMYIALRSINIFRYLDSAHEIRCEKIPRIAGLNLRV